VTGRLGYDLAALLAAVMGARFVAIVAREEARRRDPMRRFADERAALGRAVARARGFSGVR
jgi:hypothetical protein